MDGQSRSRADRFAEAALASALPPTRSPESAPGICHDTYSAHQGVEHDDMNVLCIGGRIIGSELAFEIVEAFLRASYQPQDRHARRLAKVLEIEKKGLDAYCRADLR